MQPNNLAKGQNISFHLEYNIAWYCLIKNAIFPSVQKPSLKSKNRIKN